MNSDMQLGRETLNLLLVCVREFLAQRNLTLIGNDEWVAGWDYRSPRISYGWSHPVVPHETAASLASAMAMNLRKSLQQEPVGKWSNIVISLELTQPVAPDTRKHFLVTIKLK
jgi:hypothetical protein